jgi:hypothetical protein
MSYFATNVVILIAILIVAFVLILGLANMLRGGNPNLSQLLMRWRVSLQLGAVVLILAILWARS